MRGVRTLLAFGGNITGANLINTLTRNIDQVLIGWYWGATPLGLYERAYRTLLVPINNLNAPLFTVAMPTLSRLANRPEQYRAAYLGTVEKLVMITMPLAALLITAPDLVVRLLFGPAWADAAPILRFLGIAALYQPLSYTVSWLFMTQGRAREMLKWSVVGSSLMALSVAAGLPFGAEGVAAAFAIGGLLVRMPLLFWMVGRRGPVRASDLLQAMMPAATATAATIGAVLLLRQSPAVEAVAPIGEFALLVAVTVVVALACFALLPRSRGAMRDIARLTSTLRQRGSSA
jgi:PST family polysaccharide transporter